MEALECLRTRRAVRKYKPQQITDGELNAVLEAGTYAPTSMGKQAPIIAVVQDPDTVHRLSELNRIVAGRDYDQFYGAPTVLVVFSDSTMPSCQIDGALVMGNLMNAARAVGLGSCWVHRAKEVMETEEGKALKAKWGIPEQYVAVANCILGYPDGEAPVPAPRKETYIVRT